MHSSMNQGYFLENNKKEPAVALSLAVFKTNATKHSEPGVLSLDKNIQGANI